MMRIFPEGVTEATKPMGVAMVWIAAGVLMIGGAVFVAKLWILERWPRVDGVIVSARVSETTNSDDQTRMCSAVYEINYPVAAQVHKMETGGHSFTSDCSSVEDDVLKAPGRRVVILYDADNPQLSYSNPGFNLEFFYIPFFSAILSSAFALAGFIACKLGDAMERRGVQLP